MTDRDAVKLLKYPVYKWSMYWDEREDGLSYTEAIEQAETALQERLDREKGCEWCIGFCPDVTGDPYAEYRFCPMCGRKLKGAQDER